MGGREVDRPPPETQKKRRWEKKERRKKGKKKIKGKEQDKGKRREISIFFCLFRILVYMGGSIWGGTIICMSGCKYLSSTTEQSLARG